MNTATLRLRWHPFLFLPVEWCSRPVRIVRRSLFGLTVEIDGGPGEWSVGEDEITEAAAERLAA